MPNIRRTFYKGVMNKDVDERLLDDGYFRHAENIVINTSEGSDVGAIEKCLSNKQLTFLNLGQNIETIGSYFDESKNKLYWFCTSTITSFIMEYDFNTKTLNRVLLDSRPILNRVLNFNKKHPITGIDKLISEDTSKDMLLWTDNNMEICCINIERSKTFTDGGFSKEDIYLIKKPPKEAPDIKLTYEKSSGNNIENKFISFAYRYRYLDGDYSAISPFTSYSFEAKELEVDFDTQDNLGMENRFNSATIHYNTGDHRVKEIQLLAKESNSNTVYIIENINKKNDSLGDNLIKSIKYSNNKLYKALPEKEFFKEFDNIPRKAKALCLMENRVILGNFTEGYDLKDTQNKAVRPDYEVFCLSREIDSEIYQSWSYLTQQITLQNSHPVYKSGWTLSFYLKIMNNYSSPSLKGKVMIENTFNYELTKDYSSIKQLHNDVDFQNFISTVNGYIEYNLDNWQLNPTDTIVDYPYIRSLITTDSNSLIIHLINGKMQQAHGVQDMPVIFSDDTIIKLFEAKGGRSVKSNRDYEVAIIYEDEFKRSSTALTCLSNTIHVGMDKSSYRNKLSVKIKNKPPKWAKTYRLAVKSAALTYDNLIISKFYPEDEFSWCKLEGSSKDKVKEGDNLILKRDALKEAGRTIFVPVLEKKDQPKDFIKDNKDSAGKEIIEESGTYIKINPKGFVMDSTSFEILSDSKSDYRKSSGNTPDVRLKLANISNWEDLELPEGSSVYLYISSVNHLDSGRWENCFEKTYNVNQSNYTLKKWYDDYINNKDVFGNKGNISENYKGKILLENNNTLYIDGTRSASSGGRRGYLDATIVVRKSNGYFVFETEEKKSLDTGIFYKTSQTFDIVNGFHKGNLSDQSSFTAAEIELDFYNCIAFGQGIESYKIKDQFNANALNIDLQPTSTSDEDYAEVNHYADLTYSEAFVESTGFNGLNSFNRSLVNWKELGKENGYIQKIVSREGNLLVFQTDKTGQVLYGKDAMYNADGTSNVAKVPYVLGEYIPYSGEYGMSHPESYVQESNRSYWVDSKRGVVLRLSQNGISEIVYGLENWFKNILSNKANAKIIGGYDPYKKLFLLTIGDNLPYIPIINSGVLQQQFNVSDPYTYELSIPNLNGEALFQYNITQGYATVEAVHNGINYVHSNVTGIGELAVPVLSQTGFAPFSLLTTTAEEETEIAPIQVTVTPTTPTASYSIMSIAPTGDEQKITYIVISSEKTYGITATNGFTWGDLQYYSESVSIDDSVINQFQSESGIQGVGKFPNINSLVRINSVFDNTIPYDDTNFEMKYLISQEDYTSDDLETILDNSTKLVLEFSEDDKNKIISGNFEFNEEGNIYVIWNFGSYIEEEPQPEFPILPPILFELQKETDLSVKVIITTGTDLEALSHHEISFRQLGVEKWSIPVDVDAPNAVMEQETIIDVYEARAVYEFRVRAVGLNGEVSEYLMKEIDLS